MNDPLAPEKPAFPPNGVELPKTDYSRSNNFSAKVIHESLIVGSIFDETRGGRRRRYLYEVSFSRLELPKVILTVGDPENSNSFDDRDGSGSSLRTLGGMPKKYRKDLHERAMRVAKWVRESYLEEQKFLKEKFDTAPPVFENQKRETSGTEMRVVEGWLISRVARPRNDYYHAKRQENEKEPNTPPSC